MIRAIVALDLEDGMGYKNALPWGYNKYDLQWFKENTIGNVVVMGKNTWDSLPQRPLPQRDNIIVSDTMQCRFDAEIVRRDIFRSRLSIISDCNVWLIGGSKLISSCYDMIDELWISRIQGYHTCDTFLQGYSTIFTQYETINNTDKQLYIEKWRK